MLEHDAYREVEFGGVSTFDHVKDARCLAVSRRSSADNIYVLKIGFGRYFHAARCQNGSRRISRYRGRSIRDTPRQVGRTVESFLVKSVFFTINDRLVRFGGIGISAGWFDKKTVAAGIEEADNAVAFNR